MSIKINNYNVSNAYVDTSYIKRDGAIVVSSFSSDDGNVQEQAVKGALRVTANDGYKFDLDHLEEYYFDMQFQEFTSWLSPNYNENLPFTRVKLSDFEPVTDISTYEWIEKNTNYLLYQGIVPDGSMFYTHTVGNTENLIL